MAIPTPSATANLTAGTSTRLDLVGRVIRRLGHNTQADASTNNMTTTTASATVPTDATTRYEIGDILDYWEDASFEAMRINAAITSTSLPVERAAFGTTAAAHDGSVTPKRFRKVDDTSFLSAVLSAHLDTAVASLWPDIPLIRVSTYTTTTTDRWWDLPAAAEVVLSAYQMSTVDPVEPTDLLHEGPRLFHTGFAASGKAVRLPTLDTTLTNHYVISTTKHGITDLSTTAQEIVVLHAARLALEAYSAKPIKQGEKTIVGAIEKMQIWRREEERLKSREHQRLAAYTPQVDALKFRNRA